VSSALETLALRKQLLVARSGLCRLRIQRELGVVRDALARPARLLALASSVLLFGRFASIAARLFRKS
jgi:hypothetical protein